MFNFNLDLEDDERPVVEESKAHKAKHAMFGIFVCTGIAHLILTTFDVPGISYIRVFLVGAIYVALGLAVKLNHEKAIYIAISAAIFSTISSYIEYSITGSHFFASMLTIFDGISIYLILEYVRVKDLPFPMGDHPAKEQKDKNSVAEDFSEPSTETAL